MLIYVYFRRLKINHDSHEFILESGTVANTTVHQAHNIEGQSEKFKNELLVVKCISSHVQYVLSSRYKYSMC
jgi:hypothetical protein